MYDVIIAGAGVVGAFIARTLSRYQLKICLLEKEHDVASGASKANSGIVHAGFDCMPGTLKALLNVRGAQMMEQVARELDVPYRKTGSLVVGFDEKDRNVLENLFERGAINGVKGLEMLDREQLRNLEPRISEKAIYALHAPSAAIICPYELTVAAVENAVENGAELRRSCKVEMLSFRKECVDVRAGGQSLSCRYFINAAGINAGIVAGMAGDSSVRIRPRKGEYLLMDKAVGKTVERVIFQCPTAMGKGILVTPSVDGNLIIGPSAQDVDDPQDCTTTAFGLESVFRGACRTVPGLDPKQVVTSFAGLRARPDTADFIIRSSDVDRRLIHAAGIESPGLTCAPAIGEYAAELLGSRGLEMTPKPDVKVCRDRVIRFRDLEGEALQELLEKNPAYGRLVCRCEKVTEGEVIDCIRRPAGALDLDGVKRRTRAGMGRCQGGFCTPRLVELLARELKIPFEEVTKKGGGSWLLAGKTK